HPCHGFRITHPHSPGFAISPGTASFREARWMLPGPEKAKRAAVRPACLSQRAPRESLSSLLSSRAQSRDLVSSLTMLTQTFPGLLCDEIHHLARHVNLLHHLLAGHSGFHLLIRQGALNDERLFGLGRHDDASAQLAVYLHGNLDLFFLGQSRVI